MMKSRPCEKAVALMRYAIKTTANELLPAEARLSTQRCIKSLVLSFIFIRTQGNDRMRRVGGVEINARKVSMII